MNICVKIASLSLLDLDVLLAGRVVNQINESFEDYWDSPLSYDIERLVRPSKNPDRNKSDEPFLGTLTAIAPINSQSHLHKSSQLYRVQNGAIVDKQLYNKKSHFVGNRWNFWQMMSKNCLIKMIKIADWYPSFEPVLVPRNSNLPLCHHILCPLTWACCN